MPLLRHRTTIGPGSRVLVAYSSSGLMIAGIVIDAVEGRPGKFWLDINVMGSHARQIFDKVEMQACPTLDADLLRHRLCVECCGTGLDDAEGITSGCPKCGGSGRSDLKLGVIVDGDDIRTRMVPRPPPAAN